MTDPLALANRIIDRYGNEDCPVIEGGYCVDLAKALIAATAEHQREVSDLRSGIMLACDHAASHWSRANAISALRKAANDTSRPFAPAVEKAEEEWLDDNARLRKLLREVLDAWQLQTQCASQYPDYQDDPEWKRARDIRAEAKL